MVQPFYRCQRGSKRGSRAEYPGMVKSTVASGGIILQKVDYEEDIERFLDGTAQVSLISAILVFS